MVRVTVQHIADQLGLSKYAVSRALSGKSGVSEQTRQTVIEKAEALGYLARARTRRLTASIEIIYHDQDVAQRELWMEVQAGSQAEAHRLGIATATRWTADARVAERVSSQNTGILLIGPHDDAMFKAVASAGCPGVFVGDLWRDLSPLDFIHSTDKEASREVGKHLVALGHRKIVFAHGKPGYPGRTKRFHAFSKATSDCAEVREVFFGADDAPGDFQNQLLSMARGGFVPTAFFCGNDGVAVAVVSQLMRLGLQIPRDVSVVGYGDYAIATQIAPALTTVRVPFREMGTSAIRILASRLSVTDALSGLPPVRLGLVSELIVRESTGPASSKPLPLELR